MEDHVMMGIDMVEREACLSEGVKLGPDFCFQLVFYPSPGKKIESRAYKM
jgi:hypothetical protein